MSSTDNIKDVTDLLEEEMEEEMFQSTNQHTDMFQSTNQHTDTDQTTSGLVHSATTDTLDSVYLDPPITEQELDLSGEINLENITENESNENNTDNSYKKNVPDSNKEANKDLDIVSFSVDGVDNKSRETQQPSLSNYFGAPTNTANDPFAVEDFFSTIPGDENDEQKGLDDVPNADEPIAAQDTEQQTELGLDMSELNLDDTKDILFEIDNVIVPTENSNNNHKPIEDPTVESIGFDLELDKTDTVETPVAIEDKEDFESFTADLADTETMDALGMSPATTSFMTDRNIPGYFRHSSQTDSVPSLNLSRQVSHSSAKSSSQDPEPSPREPDEQNPVTNTVDMSESAIMTTQDHTSQPITTQQLSKGEESVETTPSHQPMFPPSTTFSPVDSPVHQPSYNASRPASKISVEDQRASVSSIPTSPEHTLNAFQTFTDSGVGEDPFAASLQMSDSDRQHDAWIPSEATKAVLIAMATNTTGVYIPDSELLCTPSLVITDPQGDPVRDLVYRYMGEQEALKRQVLTPDKVSQDFDGLRQLMSHGCYRSAIDMTGRLIQDVGQAEPGENPTAHTPDTLQLWYCRLSIMMKLRMYSIVESEFVAFKNLDSPDIYYEFYPHLYPGKRGSMVVFGMRLLHAELPHHLGRSQETLDRLYYILAITQKIIKNLTDGMSEDGSAVTISADSRKASQELWQEREKQVYYCIGNTLTSLRDYDAGLSVYEILLHKDTEHKAALLSGIGRIHLQIGNVSKAVEFFQEVKSLADPSDHKATATNLLNRGFESMCQNNFSEAYQHFKSAVQVDPSNTSAVNNMSVCCLYLGKLKEALQSLEALVHGCPDKNLHEGILFNLCTLYELESSRALHKKQALLDLVSKHKGDGFPVVCLKMA